MELGTLVVVLLLLACPLMMLFMHRGGHGDHASDDAGHGHVHGAAGETSGSLDQLRGRRDELDAEIAQLEQAETETQTPAVV